MIEQRVYGQDILVYKDDNVEIHLMYLKKGAKSSVHKHKELINTFICLGGKIQIDTYKPNSEELDYSLIIEKHEKTKVSANRYHNFLTLEDTILLEIYSKIESIDIERLNVGGLFN